MKRPQIVNNESVELLTFQMKETGDISTEKVDYYVAANFKTIAKVKITETVAATIFLTHY